MTSRDMAAAAKAASRLMAAQNGEKKNRALQAVAEALASRAEEIFAANREDLRRAEQEGLEAPAMKRLRFDQGKLDEVIAGIKSLMGLPDPVGQTLSATELDQGLELFKVSCPIGVIGVVFESRPDALVQISCLCLKSGNAALLKGGSEAMLSNRILAQCIAEAAEEAGMPKHWLQLLESREEVGEMLRLDEYIDLIVPRGSNEFVRHIKENSNIAVLGHADGICHVYVDSEADLQMALDISLDSKCQYVAVCNAAEKLLLHQDIAAGFLKMALPALEARGVELRGCEKTRKLADMKPASAEDWKTEYLDYVLAIKTVASLEEAVEHINRYGSGHTEAIVSASIEHAEAFMAQVDAADVFWNCSTRFSDGFRFGLGAELGISTNKIHARGPVGLEGLCIYKWLLKGKGQIVADYAEGKKKFTHRKII